MCLGIPLKVTEIKDEQTAIAALGDSAVEICTVFTPGVQPGDYVLVHAGFSLQVLSQTKAEEIKDVLDVG